MGNVCHRIDQNDVIKVADFGLSEHIYRSGYYCQSKEDVVAREEKVPIRWMAPESIESCRYSEKTDVVSTHTHTDTHVLHRFVKHICHNNKQLVQLVKCYLSLNTIWVPAYNDVDKALLLLPFFLISNTSTQTLLNSLCNRDFGRFVAMIHYCCVVPRTSQYAESTREPRTLVASGKYNLFTELVHGIVITTD